MSSQPIKFGLVGAGAISRAYVGAFTQVDDGELVGIADISEEASRQLAQEAGCPSFSSHEELAERAGCDAVIICTPPATHPQIAADILELGAHVLCEKPLAIDSQQAAEMLARAEACGRLLTMGSKFRYVEDVIWAKRIIESGVLGEIVLMENAFTARVDMSQRWNSEPEQSGGGVLIDNGTHSIDIIRYFLGPIAEVEAVEGKRLQTAAVEDTVQLFVRSVNGVMGTVDLSWSINKERDTYIEIYGSAGTIKIGWQGSSYKPATSRDWIPFGTGYDKIKAFASQLRNFCQAIRGEEPLLITAEDALASVQVIEAAYQSMRRRSDWVQVNAGKVERRKQPRLVEAVT